MCPCLWLYWALALCRCAFTVRLISGYLVRMAMESISQWVYELITQILQKMHWSHMKKYLWNRVAELSWAVVACANLWPDVIIKIKIKANRYLQDLKYQLINDWWNGTQKAVAGTANKRGFWLNPTGLCGAIRLYSVNVSCRLPPGALCSM